jgi:hypothetical protein
LTEFDPKYKTLVAILDSIRKEAPTTAEFARFSSRKVDDTTYSRGQAFIHLWLLVKCGLDTFDTRNQQICDGEGDGGLDAFFISQQQKTVFLIQSKFKNSENKFIGESINASDLVKMELDRILNGETKDGNGNLYNARVLAFQSNLEQATRRQVYKYKVLFLANLNGYTDVQIRKLTNNLDYEVFDFERTYLELVKPVCSGTHFDPERIVIELDLFGKDVPNLKQMVDTTYGQCAVTVVFVPTAEIGRVMSIYKNAILKFNPRNYLGLSKNPVNKDIRRSIIERKNNDFALLNNGITILADEREITDKTGVKNVGRLILTNPQIINGGQTAYTLSEIYNTDFKSHADIFAGKEVLLRVVVLKDTESLDIKFRFIQAISTSTNQQTQMREADRHSTNPLLIAIQHQIFSKFGYFVELKTGEFYEGREKHFVNKLYIIDRSILLRSFSAFSGLPTPARRHSEPALYGDAFFSNLFSGTVTSDMPLLASKIMYAYLVHNFLVSKENEVGNKSLEFGYALRYGKYAVVYASALTMHNSFRKDFSSRSLDEISQYINNNIPGILERWKLFENKIQTLPSNNTYFNPTQQLADFDTYYKGTTLKADLESFFIPVEM